MTTTTKRARPALRLLEPIDIGPLRLRNRVIMPPHGRSVGDPFGPEKEFRRNLAYWEERAAEGVALMVGLNGFVDNSVLIPGFEPSGLGAVVRGVFRLPHFRERAAQWARTVQAHGALAGIQLITQGGLPHSPSGVLANPTNNQTPHALTHDEIQWFIEEFRFSAAEARAAGLDVIEVHANHEDLHQLFLSPATNRRDDAYGGDLNRRTRFLRETLEAVRSAAGQDVGLGVRLNMSELTEGGYDLEGGLEIARLLDSWGLIDYLHCVIGNNWGAPSYIQPHHYAPGQWADMAARFRQTVSVPVVYTGRVSSPKVAEEIVASGKADAVGVARAMFADPQFLSKAAQGLWDDVRPCIGTNDCLHRGVVDGLPFGCSVNPRAGREWRGPLPTADTARKVLVVGGGPAGLEVAALSAERGHSVTLWEAETELGGQMTIAAAVPENAAFVDFVRYQRRRLADLGVTIETGRRASADMVCSFDADVVIVATGAKARVPAVPGVDQPNVYLDRDVLTGKVTVDGRVALIAAEDHMQPLTTASRLVGRATDVLVLYPTAAVAPLVGKYSIGAVMDRLSRGGVRFEVMRRLVAIEGDTVVTRHTYSGLEERYDGLDAVVLSCGGEADSALAEELRGRVPELHVLGDAYAPRRISFATRQAYALALRV